MEVRQNKEEARQAPHGRSGHSLDCPKCGAHLRVVRRRIIRRRLSSSALPAQRAVPLQRQAQRPAGGGIQTVRKGSLLQRFARGNMIWGGLAALVMVLMLGEAFAANVTPQSASDPSVKHGVIYTVDRSAVASRVMSGSGATLVLSSEHQVTGVTVKGRKTSNGTLGVIVTVRGSKGETLATGRTGLPEYSGDFSVTAPLEPATISYWQVGTISVEYGR